MKRVLVVLDHLVQHKPPHLHRMQMWDIEMRMRRLHTAVAATEEYYP